MACVITSLKRWTLSPRRRRTLSAAAIVVLALVGAWLALAAVGTTKASLGPLAIDASLRPTVSGSSVLELDPVGSISVDSHRAPVTFNVAVREVNIDGLTSVVKEPSSLRNVNRDLIDDLWGVVITTAVKTFIVAALGAGVLTGIVLRSWRRGLMASGFMMAVVALIYGIAAITYNENAVREPTFNGPLQAAPSVIGNAEDIANNFDAYADQLAGLVTNVASLYETTLSLPTAGPPDDSIRVLHVSDLHLNPAAWKVISSISEQYDVDAIIDTGDIADHGTVLENYYVRPISSLDRPYIYVRGNHDSAATQAAIARQSGAIVLDGEAATVAGLKFFGARDPRFTPDKTSGDDRNDETLLNATKRLAHQARQLHPPADVLAFHDLSHAEELEGVAPVVLGGHAHKRDAYTLGKTTQVLVQGSTGGAGLRALEREDPTPVMLSVLYFDPESKQLTAWDDLTLGGLGLTSAEVTRHHTTLSLPPGLAN